MSRMLLTTDAVGGVWRYSLDLARGLAGHGVSVTIAVLGPEPSTAQMQQAAEFTVMRTGLPLDWTAARPADLDAAAGILADIARASRARTIHLHAPALVGSALWPAPVVAVAHSCVATWWEAAGDGALPADLAWRAAATARGMASADAVIAPTAAFASALSRAYPHAGPVAVVHNGHAAQPPGALGWEPFVLTAGRLWDRGKNVAALDAAAPAIGAPVLAAGALAGPDGARAELRHANALGELNAAALDARMRAGQVFASPALYEPFGLAVLEAAARGMALVLSDIATFRELWDGAALFVPATEPAALAAACRDILARPDLRARLGRAARTRAAEYRLETTVLATLGVHRGLLGRTMAA